MKKYLLLFLICTSLSAQNLDELVGENWKCVAVGAALGAGVTKGYDVTMGDGKRVAELSSCQKIESEKRRLACYDSVMRKKYSISNVLGDK
jgi:hypothetical protein